MEERKKEEPPKKEESKKEESKKGQWRTSELVCDDTEMTVTLHHTDRRGAITGEDALFMKESVIDYERWTESLDDTCFYVWENFGNFPTVKNKLESKGSIDWLYHWGKWYNNGTKSSQFGAWYHWGRWYNNGIETVGREREREKIELNWNLWCW